MMIRIIICDTVAPSFLHNFRCRVFSVSSGGGCDVINRGRASIIIWWSSMEKKSSSFVVCPTLFIVGIIRGRILLL